MLLGLSMEQWGYMISRYREHAHYSAGDPPLNISGAVALDAWWKSNGWPEPLSVTIVGVKHDIDIVWAGNLFKEIIKNER